MSLTGALEYEPFAERHIDGAVALSAELGWQSYSEPAMARRALSAQGAVTWVAREGVSLVGLAHLLTDGCVQAHLSLIGVLPSHRRRGIARVLLRRAFEESGARWLDLAAEDGSEPFYRSFVHERRAGLRLYPRERGQS